MAKRWIQDLVSRRQLTQAELQRKAELEAVAKIRTPDLFRSLRDCMERDVAEYLSTPGSRQIRFQPRDDRTFEVEYPLYPHFWLRLSIETGMMEYIITTRSSSSAKDVRKEGTILATATGQDELYYRLEGVDIPNEAEVSERLLRPLLEFVERQ